MQKNNNKINNNYNENDNENDENNQSFCSIKNTKNNMNI